MEALQIPAEERVTVIFHNVQLAGLLAMNFQTS